MWSNHIYVFNAKITCQFFYFQPRYSFKEKRAAISLKETMLKKKKERLLSEIS